MDLDAGVEAQSAKANLEDWCSIDGCTRPARKATLCWAHAKRKVRGQSLTAEPIMERTVDPWTALTDAALEYSDADSEDDFRSACDTLRKRAQAWARVNSYAIVAQRIKEGLSRAKEKGRHIGRPRVSRSQVWNQLVLLAGDRESTATKLGISRRTVDRIVAEGIKDG